MNSRPLIGITSDFIADKSRYALAYDYVTAVERAGGLPLMLPFQVDHGLIPQLVDTLDGIIFSGGDDLDPSRWGEPRHANAVPTHPLRERFELALLATAEQRRLPILGICLGSQLINVHRGGSLIQFLPDVPRDGAIEHRKLGDHATRHEVHLLPGTHLARAIGCERCSVNTRHKQAIGRLGRGLRIAAAAPDGVIEGIEDPDYPLLLAVQWHPENLFAESEHLNLFRLLVDTAAKEKAAQRQSGVSQGRFAD